MEYNASLDSLCKGITIGVIVVFIGIGSIHVKGIMNAHGNWIPMLVHSSIMLFLLLTLVVSYGYSIKSYTVTSDELIIHRPIKDRVIKIEDITEIRIVDSTDMQGTIRTFGNGGLFGYYGKYYNSNIGNMTWYATQRKNRILICTQQSGKIIISPDDLSLADKLQTLRHPAIN